MNDVEIKDIDGIAASASQLDKLKNLLIEFGVEFTQADYENLSYIDFIKEGHLAETSFAFDGNGKFSHITEG